MPQSKYAVFKYKCENIIKNISIKYNFDYVIIRCPLIIGENVKANFNLLLNIIYYRIPIPINLLDNKRNFISVYNLIYFIYKCIDNKKVNNQILSIHDGEEYSMKLIYEKISQLMNKKLNKFYLPKFIIEFIFIIFFKKNIYNKIFSDFVINCENSFKLIQWKSKYNIDYTLQLTVKNFLLKKKNDQ